MTAVAFFFYLITDTTFHFAAGVAKRRSGAAWGIFGFNLVMPKRFRVDARPAEQLSAGANKWRKFYATAERIAFGGLVACFPVVLAGGLVGFAALRGDI